MANRARNAHSSNQCILPRPGLWPHRYQLHAVRKKNILITGTCTWGFNDVAHPSVTPGLTVPWPNSTPPLQWSTTTLTSASWSSTARYIQEHKLVTLVCSTVNWLGPSHLTHRAVTSLVAWPQKNTARPWRWWGVQSVALTWPSAPGRKMPLSSLSTLGTSTGMTRVTEISFGMSVPSHHNNNCTFKELASCLIAAWSLHDRGMLMSACDLASVTKPWEVQERVSCLLSLLASVWMETANLKLE